MPVVPGVLRSLVATGACGASTALLAHVGASTARVSHVRLDEVVSLAVLAVGAAAAALLTVGCVLLTLTAVARAAGRTLDRLERFTTRLTPALLRRAVAVSITTGIGLGAVSGVATASEIDLGWEVTESTPAPQEPARAAPTTEDPDLGDVDGAAAERVAERVAERGAERAAEREPAGPSSSAPDPATTTAPIAATTTTAVTHTPVDVGPAAGVTVTVGPGDTLWGIAASHLPPGSDDATIAAAWPRWYEANREAVGSDPDLVHPGQVLTAPGAP